jgi:hypothetical protein
MNYIIKYKNVFYKTESEDLIKKVKTYNKLNCGCRGTKVMALELRAKIICELVRVTETRHGNVITMGDFLE